MKHLYFILVITAIALMNCDGRKSQNEALNNSIEKFKVSFEPIEFDEYIPQKYSETIKDSVLSNGYNVSIKTYSDMNKSVEYSYTESTIDHKINYRNWISQVTIRKADKIVFNECIDTDFFLENGININQLTINLINTGVWVDEEESINKDGIYLLTEFLDVKEDNSLLYQIKIDEKGKYSFEKLNLKKTV